MKKIITLISVIAFNANIIIAQIPNNGFENWTSIGAYSNPDNWETLNNITSLASVYTATKGTPGSPGTSFLMLTSKTVSTTVVNGVAVCGKLNPITQQPASGFPFTQQPQSFTGKWQHMIYGSSQGSIKVSLSKWNAITNTREIVATANQTLSGMAMSWATFTINFNYTSSAIPDSCIIFLQASGNTPTNNDYLWVDNLAFNGTVTGLSTFKNAHSTILVYPNPSKDYITIELIDLKESSVKVQLVDVIGKLIKEININNVHGNYKRELNVTDVEKGSYFLKISSNDISETKKIIIE